jgi:hypothetical protein
MAGFPATNGLAAALTNHHAAAPVPKIPIKSKHIVDHSMSVAAPQATKFAMPPVQMIEAMVKAFNTSWRVGGNKGVHDESRRKFFSAYIHPVLDMCWSFFMYKGKPYVYEKQKLDLTFPYAEGQGKVTPEKQFKDAHRELRIFIDKHAWNLKADAYLLYDIWSVQVQGCRQCA